MTALDEVLPPGSARRQVAFTVAAAAGLLLLTQVVLPGSGGGGRGTPTSILFSGLVSGLVTSLTAAGIVLLYRTQRIINFAQAALGVAGAILVFELVRYTPVPFLVAFLMGLAVAGGIGVVVGLLALRFADAPRLVVTVFTILLAAALAGFSQSVRNLPFFPPSDERTLAENLGGDDIQAFLPFSGLDFQVGGLSISYGFAELFAIYVSVFAVLGLAVFFRWTRAGIAVRAMAENSERASLLGIGVGALSCVVWGIAGVLAGASVTLNGILDTPGSATGFAPAVLLPALAAAVLGRLSSLPLTVASAVGLGVAADALDWSLDEATKPLVQVGFFLVIAVGLLLQRRGILRSEDASTTSSWQATEELRPVPIELADVPGVRIGRYALIATGLVAVVLYPFIVSPGAQSLGGVIALNAIVVLSLVVLTGWAGQVSLGQYAFVAIGAVVGGAMSSRAGIPFWFAVPLTTVIVGALAALIGIPALRVRGLLLLVSTFAFAVAVRAVLFEERFFGWLLPRSVDRPDLFLIDFEDERSMYFLCVAALVLAIVVVLNLRKARFGRVLIALRENEPNVQSFGIGAVRTKLAAFAVSGGLCGFAGAILAHQARAVTPSSFGVQASLDVFIVSIFGGVSSVAGALIGAAYFNGLRFFFRAELFLDFLTAGVPLYLLYAAPGGVASLLTKARDAGLRIVAQRRQIVVPSLFADYDPEALANRLVPLSEPLSGGGLSALGSTRYTLGSELHLGGGWQPANGSAVSNGDGDAAAIGAAAKSTVEREAPSFAAEARP